MSGKVGATLRMALRMSSRAALALFLMPASGLASDSDRITLNPDSSYPEGPVVAEGILYYAEMGNDRVMRWDGRANSVVWTRDGCSPTSVSRAAEGKLNILCHSEEAVIRISTEGETLKVIDRDKDGQTFRSPNASVNDAKGGVYFSSSGTFGPAAPAGGAVLYLDAEDRLSRVAEDIHYANGVALSPDGKLLYVSEHLERRILVYDVADDGSLSGRRVFVVVDDLVGAAADRGWEVGPDGLATDGEGHLFAAEYGGGRFLVIDTDGKLIATVEVPDTYITALAFGADEDRIFVTAPTTRMFPMSGKVYSIANPLLRQH
jgi:gluconolactonase